MTTKIARQAGGAHADPRRADLRRRAHPRRLPDPLSRGLRQAARLSRQRRVGAEAALRHRGDGPPLPVRIRERAPRAALPLQRRHLQVRGGARDRRGASSTPAASTRSSSRRTPPTRSTSSRIRSAAWCIGEGDEIVLSIMEHHSNIVPWHFHRERNGAVLKWAPITDSGELLLEEFERLLTPRTKLVAITHMSNVLGTLVPVKEVIRIAHDRGIPVLVDGSQAAVHMAIDVHDLDCDFYVFTGHKTYGPTRHRRALRQEGASRRHAALPGRRQHDRERARRPHHLRQDRRRSSRPERRRSPRRSGSAPRSTT